MAVKQNVKPKTSSIVLKINTSIQIKRILKEILADVFLWCLFWSGACAVIELEHGGIDFTATRVLQDNVMLSPLERLKHFAYLVGPVKETFKVPLGLYLFYATILIGVIFIIQFLGWCLAWGVQNRTLRHYLRPLDELALAAERYSTQGINEHQIQDLEEAIDNLTASENSIRVGDSDLQGIENAINNLLKRLQASYREQTRFVDDASHELRTPIAVIQGYASMLERWGMDDREALEEGVHAISEEADHMKVLVDQLLFLARGDGGRQQLKLEMIQGEELLKEICEESEMIDADHEYLLKSTGEAFVQADYGMLKQALRILVDNAVKYTPKGGHITLRLDQSDPNYLKFSVQDEGIGVDAEEAAKMFERFFRGDEVRGTTKGSGLGLSIAKWIVDRHNGTIEVLSYKEIGTRMTIRIPR